MASTATSVVQTVTSKSKEKDSSKETQKASKPTLAEIFKTLEYGPAPESPDVAYAWLDDHQRSFGHFIDGKWLNPENRKRYESRCPATG